MQEKVNANEVDCRDSEINDELAGVLNAISVVSKRLAKKLMMLDRQATATEEGGTQNEQDE